MKEPAELAVRDIRKYIWNGKPHLSLRDLWDYLNRYTCLPRLKDQRVLVKTVQAAVAGTVPGPFAYAERWDAAAGEYKGLIIEATPSALVVIDSDSVIVKPDVALAHRPKPAAPAEPTPAEGGDGGGVSEPPADDGPKPGREPKPTMPHRFIGTVMISADRPARDMHQIVEAIVEQLTTLSGSEVSLKLEIDAEVPGGLDRGKVRTLLENANTLGFIDKSLE